jgi:hypothetical protein
MTFPGTKLALLRRIDAVATRAWDERPKIGEAVCLGLKHDDQRLKIEPDLVGRIGASKCDARNQQLSI